MRRFSDPSYTQNYHHQLITDLAPALFLPIFFLFFILSFSSPLPISLFCSGGCVPQRPSVRTRSPYKPGSGEKRGNRPPSTTDLKEREAPPRVTLRHHHPTFRHPLAARHKLNSRATHVAVYPYTRCRPPIPALFFTRRWTEFLLLTAH